MPGAPPKCPNPLFTRWLQEWRDEAAREGRVKSQRAYERALSSLRKYPLPLHSGCEARILQYFGEQICKQLDEQLERYRSNENTEAAAAPLEKPSPPLQEQENEDPPSGREGLRSQEKQLTSRKTTRKYLPAQRSGAYAILVALYQEEKNPHTRGYLTKPELQRAAQPLCDKSFTQVDPGKRNTAWAAAGTLLRKELVLKTNIPARYSLTEKGRALAQELTALEEPKEKDPNLPMASAPRSAGLQVVSESEGQDPSNSIRDTFPESSDGEPRGGLDQPQCIFPPGKFDVILCVDFIETTGGAASRKQEMVLELQRQNVPFTVRKLHVGDFVWVARERVSAVAGQLQPPKAQELVLDYIVERKRMSDLCGSIIDGRFREQKFRLRQCGISHPIYLVEDSGSVQHLSLPEKTLQQAIINTQVVDGFFVKRTQDLRETVAYLTLMTRHLSKLYQDKTLISCTKEELERLRPLLASESSCRLMTFSEFNEGAMKNKAQTVSEVFARQLMQVSGVSGDKAAAILERYRTPASLLAAYATCQDPQSQERLLSETKFGKLQRNLGPALSKTLAQLYCTAGPLP